MAAWRALLDTGVWQDRGTPPHVSSTAHCVATSVTAHTIILGIGTVVYKQTSANGGTSWSESSGTLPNSFSGDVWSRGGKYYALITENLDNPGVGGVYESTDGLAWTRIAAASFDTGGGNYVGVQGWARTSAGVYYCQKETSAASPINLYKDTRSTLIASYAAPQFTNVGGGGMGSGLAADVAFFTLNDSSKTPQARLMRIAASVVTDVTPGFFVTGDQATPTTARSIDGSTFIMGTSIFGTARCIRSTDGGATWTNITTALGTPSQVKIEPDPTVSNQWWALVNNGTDWRPWKSTDGGVTWAAIAGAAAANGNPLVPIGGVYR